MHDLSPNVGFLFTFDADQASDPVRFKVITRRCFELHRPEPVEATG